MGCHVRSSGSSMPKLPSAATLFSGPANTGCSIYTRLEPKLTAENSVCTVPPTTICGGSRIFGKDRPIDRLGLVREQSPS